MALKVCPRCKRLIQAGLAYCQDCRPIVEESRAAEAERRAELRRKKYNREYNRQRDPKYAAFYRSKAWKAQSRAKLQSCGYRCQAKLDGCARIACEVHHIRPIKTEEGWEKRLDWDNLMGVCIHCHNILDKKFFNNNRKDDGVIDLRNVER